MVFDSSRFIDIHSHILPGVDDGPTDIRQSIGLAGCYTKQGIKKIITTPHFLPGTAWAKTAAQIKIAVKNLNQVFVQKNIALQVYPGMEIAFHAKLMERFKRKELLPLGNSRNYLIEPSFNDSQKEILQCVKFLLSMGARVIIAHPERISSFQNALEPLIELTADGLETQINIGSILGKFGIKSRAAADLLLEKGAVHYLASDAHGSAKRYPPIGKEWKKLEKTIGDKLIMQLCVTNPSKLI